MENLIAPEAAQSAGYLQHTANYQRKVNKGKHHRTTLNLRDTNEARPESFGYSENQFTLCDRSHDSCDGFNGFSDRLYFIQYKDFQVILSLFYIY
jgi:hypothetical protein